MKRFHALFFTTILFLYSCDENKDLIQEYSVSYVVSDRTLGAAPIDSKSPYLFGETVLVLDIGEIFTDSLFFAGWSDGIKNYYADDEFIIENDIIFTDSWADKKVTDIDGNTYNVIKIGHQIWMAENLRTTRLKDGTPIEEIINDSVWYSSVSPAFCWYNNDSLLFAKDYGALYNGYSILSDKLCPLGWHVPSELEWKTMQSYLGGSRIAGGKLKAIGFDHWRKPNEEATDDYGFSALPGGNRAGGTSGLFQFQGNLGFWWCVTNIGGLANYHMFYHSSTLSISVAGLNDGMSVRCIKN
jgi:uncharacterized protein (TIGR02145 family)